MSEISHVKYLANPKYRKFPFKGLIGWILANRPPSVEDLQSKYEFRYYSTMNKAVTDVNNGTTANADAEKGTAVAGVYTDENGGKNVVLLKDHTEASRITLSADMTVNLGGHMFSTGDKVGIDIASGNIFIDGRLHRSGVHVIRNDGGNAKVLQLKSAYTGACTVIGGDYTGESNGATNNACVAVLGGSVNIRSANIYAIDINGTTQGVSVNDGANVSIFNSNIRAISTKGKTRGINSAGTASVSQCDILAYSNYHGDDSDYTEDSVGIQNTGTMTIHDCYSMGAHSGVSNLGTLYVNGGTYEGYGHGGFYFSGTGTTSYARNAVIRDCDMPDGYTATSQRNGAGFYLGDATNVNVYMDNCDIYGTAASQIFVIKTTDNALYISNSTINNQNGGATNVRIDSGNTLYLGRGNNFDATNTNNPEAVVVTDEVYREVA